MNNVDKFIAPMNLTGELFNTQLYDKLTSIRHYNIVNIIAY